MPEKKTVLEEEERKIILERIVRTTMAMSAIQIGEGVKMTMIDAPDMMIIVEEMTVVTMIAILEGLTANGTEKINMTMTGPGGLTVNGIEKVEMTMTGPAGTEVEISQSRLVALCPRNDRLLSNPPLVHALALGLSPLRLSTRPNPTSLILGCWLQRRMLSS